jgi:hypothetical protein
MTLSETLQIAGWVLTVYGQVQIGRMSRNGFITWIVANLVMIALCMTEGLLWSCGMYATNIAVCAWSFRRWSAPEPAGRPLFVKRQPSWLTAQWRRDVG